MTLVNSIRLHHLSYPIYRIGFVKPTQESGVTSYIRVYTEDNFNRYEYRIVDDTNMPGNSLAKRRLYMLSNGIRLKKLSIAIFMLGDLIKLATPSTWFIDSNGLVFKYIKSTKSRLIFKRISKVITLPTGGALLDIESFNTRFKCLYEPKPNEIYAGVLMHNMGSILYSIHDQKYDDTWRKV